MRLRTFGAHGVLLTIGETTREKWGPSFETPAPIQTATMRSLRATIRSTGPSTAKKMSAGTYCSLRAARNTTLFAQAHHDEQADQHDQQRGVDQGDAGPGHGRHDERGDQGGEDREVEGDVGDRAPVTSGEGHLARPRREADGVRASPVPGAAGHRLEVAGQRPPRTG